MWYVYTLISICLFASVELFYKKYVEANPKISANSLSVFSNLWIFIVSGVYIVLSRISIDFTTIPYVLLLLNAFFFTLATAFYYESYKHISASIATILGMSSAVVSTLLGIYFFQESNSWIKFLGTGIIMISIVVLYWEKARISLKYYSFALIGGALYGLAYIIDKELIVTQSMPITNLLFLSVLFAIPMKILLNGRTFFTSAKKINLQSHISAFMIGLSNVGAYGLMYRAYQAGGEVGKIDSLNNLVIFMVIIGEYIFFKDSHSLKRKIIAGMIAVCGAYLLR